MTERDENFICVVVKPVESECYEVLVKERNMTARLVWLDLLGPLNVGEEIEGTGAGCCDDGKLLVCPDLPEIRRRKMLEKKLNNDPNPNWP